MLIIGSIFTGNDHVNWLRSIILIHCQESKFLLLASTDCLPSHPTTDRGVTLCWMFGETLSCYCKYSFPWPWISSTWPVGVMCSSDHCHFSQLNTGSVYNFPILFMVSTRRIQIARRWLLRTLRTCMLFTRSRRESTYQSISIAESATLAPFAPLT